METNKEQALIPMEEYNKLKEIKEEYLKLKGKQHFTINLYMRFMDFSYSRFSKNDEYKQFNFTDFNSLSQNEEIEKTFIGYMEEIEKFIERKNNNIDNEIKKLEKDYSEKIIELEDRINKIPKWIRNMFK